MVFINIFYVFFVLLLKESQSNNPGDGTLRLYDGETENKGILEIFHNNRWGYICDFNWYVAAGRVACRQMGFPGYTSYSKSRRVRNTFWLASVRCSGHESSIINCPKGGWSSYSGYCGIYDGIYLQCLPKVYFGRMIGSSVYPLDNFATLQHSTTLHCSTQYANSAVKIGWSFTPIGQDIEESLTDSARWDSSSSNSKLYVSTSKLGFYSCYTIQGGVSKKYTVNLSQPPLDKGCQGGYCFGVFKPDRAINWATAQSNCISWGGDLASIRSMGEEKYILSLGNSSYGSCWIGHHDRYNEAGENATLFVSVGGSTSSYRNFYINEPNQSGNEDCVALRDWDEGGWRDVPCDSTNMCYVCGKPNCREDSCFEVLTRSTGVDWESAQSQCELKGGSLASISSELEEKFILNLMTDSSSQCWIGLNDRDREAGLNPNDYTWEDGNNAIYRHFRDEVVNTYRDCAVLSREDGTWVSADCNDTYTCYICKGAELCQSGYMFNPSQYDCLDINECSVANDCEQICTNTVGSYTCSCRERYYLSNFTSCELIHLEIELNGTSSSSKSIQLNWYTMYRPSNRLSEISYSVWIRDITFEVDRRFGLKYTTSYQKQLVLDLLPFRTYEIYIEAIDNETRNSSNTITIQTLTDIPSTPPATLNAFSTNPITIRLNLSPPSRETRNGIIIGYSILYSRIDQTREQQELISANLHTYDVTNLAEYTNYKIRVAAITSAGTGVYTEYVRTRTMESIPTASPIIVFIAKSPNSIELLLKPPSDLEEVNGVITAYTVVYSGDNVDTEDRTEIFTVESAVYYLTPISVNLTGLEEAVGYSIQARISTKVGGGPYSTAVEVTTTETAPTGPPLLFNILIHLPTLLTISWSPPELELQNGIITGYLVHYHGISIDTDERNFTTQSLIVNLTNLEEGALYEIEVCALNNAGEGPCLEVENRTQEIPPSQCPQNVQVEVDGSTSLLISWNSMLMTEENGVITSYMIIAKGHGYDTGEYVRTAKSDATYFTIEDLQEANEYSVSIAAANNAGIGPFSTELTAITNEDNPSGDPEDLFGIGTETVILLIWNPPAGIERNGKIIKYEIMYFGININRTKTHLFTTQLRVVIHNLHPGERYQLKIRAFTAQGAGPYSPILPIVMYENIPTAPPTNITLIPLSSTQIRVTWQELPLYDRNGAIRGYDLSISLLNNFSQVRVTEVSELVRTYTFSNLEPNTSYSVKIRARTLPGAGPYSEAVSITTLEKSIPV
ncbi:Receptor-type tyrosine-protein phosphatase delta-like isoform X10 [Oopsacas minuta]|uniref:Receptor-type tyrosine-protein phosphatase delta-like isoform X10 n=1 Tax=Oopsacas minuta TaxID=111878 RepID=A0AAV7K0S8_9METZ|nr:Receptor-type tyrosine-protein phosphatase delta-like isoform X10 [Oopsacas minuta]